MDHHAVRVHGRKPNGFSTLTSKSSVCISRDRPLSTLQIVLFGPDSKSSTFKSSLWRTSLLNAVGTCYSKNLGTAYESLGWLKLAKKTLRRCQAEIN